MKHGYIPITALQYRFVTACNNGSEANRDAMGRCLCILLSLYSTAEMKTWLESPNPALDNQIPIELFEQGKAKTVQDMLEVIESGHYT